MSVNLFSNVVYKQSSGSASDMGAYVSRIRTFLPELDEAETWIRSGLYIGEKFKGHISSFRLLGSQKTILGHSRIEVLLVKTQIGISLSDSEDLCIEFISDHLLQTAADAAFVLLVPSSGHGWRFFFIKSAKHSTIKIPDDILRHICTGTVKIYLRRSCSLSDQVIDGYLSTGYALFDDSIIRTKAREIDKALRDIKFCDIAVGSGQMAITMSSLVSQIRFGLNKYLGNTAERTEKNFRSHFFKHSLYAADFDAGALEIFKIGLRLDSDSYKSISNDNFIWGNILTEDLFKDRNFDITATNPPHLREDEFSFIKDKLEGYSSFRNNADLYCYYAERAFGITKEGGSVGLLMSNRWLRSEYGCGLRNFLSGRNIFEIIDYGNIPPVEGISTPLSVVIAANMPPAAAIKVTSVEDTDHENLSILVEETSTLLEPSALSEERWIFGSLDIAELIEKINGSGIPLGEYVKGGIFRGLLTGLNEAFTVDKAKAEQMIKTDAATASILRPFLSGRNVKRYAEPSVKNFLIFIPKGSTDEMRGNADPWIWFSTSYPAVAAHLNKFKEKAQKRMDQGDYWWELRSCTYYPEFEKTKIISPAIVKQISAAIDTKNLFSNDKTTIIPTEDFYLLGLLNSRLMDFCMRRISTELLNGYYELKPANLQELPIKPISPTNSFHMILKSDIETGAMKLSNSPDLSREEVREEERRINRAVYKLYKLTPAEISLVENN